MSTLRLPVLLGLASSTLPGVAAPTVTLLTPNATVARPASGTVRYDFLGTVTADPGLTIQNVSAVFPFTPDLAHSLTASINPDVYGTATYTGTLFSVFVDAVSTPGTYDAGPGGGEAYYLVSDVSDSNGSASVSYSLTVLAVPEPSALTLCLPALGLLRRRRRA